MPFKIVAFMYIIKGTQNHIEYHLDLNYFLIFNVTYSMKYKYKINKASNESL